MLHCKRLSFYPVLRIRIPRICMFLCLFRILQSEVRIRILLSSRDHAKTVRKPLVPNVLWLLYDFLFLKNDVNVPSKSNKQKNSGKNCFLLESWRSMTKIAGSLAGSISQRHGSGNPGPYQDVTDPQHCSFTTIFKWCTLSLVIWILIRMGNFGSGSMGPNSA